MNFKPVFYIQKNHFFRVLKTRNFVESLRLYRILPSQTHARFSFQVGSIVLLRGFPASPSVERCSKPRQRPLVNKKALIKRGLTRARFKSNNIVGKLLIPTFRRFRLLERSRRVWKQLYRF